MARCMRPCQAVPKCDGSDKERAEKMPVVGVFVSLRKEMKCIG
jgi:hypothetical protein